MIEIGLMSFLLLVKREADEQEQAVHHSIDIKHEQIEIPETLTDGDQSDRKENVVFTPQNGDKLIEPQLQGNLEIIEEKIIICKKVPKKFISHKQNMQHKFQPQHSIGPQGVVVPKVTKQLVSIKIICK